MSKFFSESEIDSNSPQRGHFKKLSSPGRDTIILLLDQRARISLMPEAKGAHVRTYR
jgi:hypothetical protein